MKTIKLIALLMLCVFETDSYAQLNMGLMLC